MKKKKTNMYMKKQTLYTKKKTPTYEKTLLANEKKNVHGKKKNDSPSDYKRTCTRKKQQTYILNEITSCHITNTHLHMNTTCILQLNIHDNVHKKKKKTEHVDETTHTRIWDIMILHTT